MLERVTADNGVQWLRSSVMADVPGIRHGFTTRIGGMSKPPFDTLNLGSLAKGPGTDLNVHTSENYRRMRAALRLERVPRYGPVQCHGKEVWLVDDVAPMRPRDAPKADAVVTSQAGKMLVIRTADCVPVVLASADGGVVGAVHAGWRGLLAGVLEATVAVMRERGAGEMVAAIGPCISVAHFEVGPEVAAAFTAAGLADVVRPGQGDRSHVDLVAATLRRLGAAGVADARVDRGDVCTYRDEASFFSYRRDVTHRGSSRTGHMAAVIAKL